MTGCTHRWCSLRDPSDCSGCRRHGGGRKVVRARCLHRADASHLSRSARGRSHSCPGGMVRSGRCVDMAARRPWIGSSIGSTLSLRTGAPAPTADNAPRREVLRPGRDAAVRLLGNREAQQSGSSSDCRLPLPPRSTRMARAKSVSRSFVGIGSHERRGGGEVVHLSRLSHGRIVARPPARRGRLHRTVVCPKPPCGCGLAAPARDGRRGRLQVLPESADVLGVNSASAPRDVPRSSPSVAGRA